MATTPDSLITEDVDSYAFYLLRDESLAFCKTESELPYHKNRSQYLCSGRVSPKFNKIVFWADPVNPNRAVQLLIEQGRIDPSCKWEVAGSQTVRVKHRKHAPVPVSGVLKAGVRKNEVANLINSGMKVQSKGDNPPSE